jgi:hypothetical protein
LAVWNCTETQTFGCQVAVDPRDGKEEKMTLLLALIIFLVLFGVVGGLAITKFLFFVLIVAALLALIRVFSRTA